MEGEFQFAQSMDGNTTEEIQEALEESIKGELTHILVSFCSCCDFAAVPWRVCRVDCSGGVPRSSIAPEYSA